MALTKEQIRQMMANRPKQTQAFTGILPGLENLTGELSVAELSAADLAAIQDLATTEGGYRSELDMAATFARGLVQRGTTERIYEDADTGMIATWGLSILRPVVVGIKAVSRLSKDALENEKKDSSFPPTSASDGSSTGNSEATPPAEPSMNS